MPKIRLGLLVAAVLPLAALTAACGDDAPADATVAVTGTDTKCEVADTSLSAGKIVFEFKNEGKKATELYVLGAEDRVIDEVENVLPGQTSPLDVDLKAGEYTLACKPGQTGDGIRQEITVTGAGGETDAEAAEAEREIHVEAREYAYSFVDELKVAKGDAVKFELSNKGVENHEFEVLDPSGEAIGEVVEIGPGKEGKATMEFKEAGSYSYQCLIEAPDGVQHKDKGMQGSFEVA
jgi:uncharacterized cupredoxin-like copper-binding protein